ncbi:MAG: hypothetical protein AAF496_14035 [Pseudomonadota bacterium]
MTYQPHDKILGAAHPHGKDGPVSTRLSSAVPDLLRPAFSEGDPIDSPFNPAMMPE